VKSRDAGARGQEIRLLGGQPSPQNSPIPPTSPQL